ncbi:MAG: sigma-70 family RNA polymerase sigma factor [Candidatus Latescibacteria bacterium]|nr:sigma-70 family RNA polymerase sigma factor [Candidatus Latescibacterota bacterium]
MFTSVDLPYEADPAIQETDNTALVAQALDKGPEAFGPIVLRYKDAVFGVALSRLRNFHDAEDLTQTTFVEAFDRLGDLKDPRRLGAWLRTIAIHRCINFLQRQGRIVDFETVSEPVSKSPSPAADFERKRLQELVLEAVGRLSRVQRETVLLHYISEYTVAQVAAIQEVPVGTIKRRLHDARKRLQQDMMDMVEDILKDNAPNQAMEARVFDLLCAYPSGGDFSDGKTVATLEAIGEAGKGGFTRALELPHWRSRRLAVSYLAREYGDGGPSKEFAIERLQDALQDGNWGVRKAAAHTLMHGKPGQSNEERGRNIVPHLIPLLSDPSKRVRSAVVLDLCFWVCSNVSKELVQQAIPLRAVCRAAAAETDAKILKRFQWLLGLLTQETDD